MNQNTHSISIAKRLAKLPKEKKIQFRALLKEKNIDSWQLPIVAAARKDEMEVLSNAQQRLWFINHYEQGSSAYNLFTRLDIKGDIDTEALKLALLEVLNRHAILRSTYHLADGIPMQRTEADYELPFWVESDVSDLDLRSLTVADAVFDLENELPLRIYLLSDKSKQHRLVFVAHHIAFDAWSEAVLVKEFSECYARFTSQGSVQVSPVPELQYADFAQWQQEWLESEAAESQLEYWKKQLTGMPECMPLPLDFPRPDVLSRTYQGAEVQLDVPGNIYLKLQDMAREQGTTLYSVMQAGFSLLLNQLGAGQDICLGTSVASRQRPELESMIGFLVNTLVIRHQLQDKQSFRQLIDQVSETTREAFEHQELPFDLVVDKLNIPRGRAWSPLFQVLFVHRNVPRQTLQLGELELTQVPHQSNRSRFDLTLRLTEDNNNLRLDLEYSRELFSKDTIVNLLNLYLQLLSSCLSTPDILINIEQTSVVKNAIEQSVTDDSKAKDALTTEPKLQITSQLIVLFSDMLGRDVLAGDSFFELGGDSILSLQLVAKAKKSGLTLTPKLLFKAQTPQAIAAAIISELPTKAEPIVTDSPLLTPALLAAFKQLLGNQELTDKDSFFEFGGDSILSLQLVAKLKKQGIKVTPKQVFALQTPYHIAQALAAEEGHSDAINNELVKDNISATSEYAMAPIQHWFFEQQLKHAEHWNQSVLLSHDKVLDVASFTKAVEQVLTIHQQLAMNFIPGKGDEYQQFIANNQLDVRSHTIHSEELSSQLSSLQGTLALSGKAPIRVDLFKLTDQEQGRILFTAHHLVVDAVSWRVLVTQIWQTYQLLSHGLSTDGSLEAYQTTSYQAWVDDLLHWPKHKIKAARDYWWPLANEAQEIQQTWVSLPMSNLENTHTIENHIRDVDAVEVKLPANLSEKLISQSLSAYQLKIDELMLAAVTFAMSQWRGTNKMLIELESHGRHHDDLDLSQTVGWFTSRYPVLLESIDSCSSDLLMRQHILSIKDQLRAVPDYGQGFGVLKYLHNEVKELVTPTLVFNYLGQIDKGMMSQGVGLATELIPNQRHGGNTRPQWLDLNAMIIGGELSMRWNYNTLAHTKIEIELLALAVIEYLSKMIEHCEHTDNAISKSEVPLLTLTQPELDRLVDLIPAPQDTIKDIYPLTPLQNGMLFHTLSEQSLGMYVNQSLVELDGELDIKALESAWQWVINQHDMLRTGFMWQQLDEPIQYVVKESQVDWQNINYLEKIISEAEAELKVLAEQEIDTGFELNKAGLMRFKLVTLAENHHCLIWTRHHLIVDGWCTNLVIREVQQAYLAICANRTPANSHRPPFRNFIEWLGNRELKESEAYWQHCLNGYDTMARLPRPFSCNSGVSQQTEHLSIEQTESLKSLAAKSRLTLNSLCQAVWALTLQRYTGSNDLVFGVTSAGRPDDLANANDIVGVFITSIPLRAQLSGEQSWIDLALQLQDQMIESREHEHVSLSNIQRLTGHQVDLFDNLLVFENYPADKQPVDRNLTLGVRETTERNNYPLTMIIIPHQRLDFRVVSNNSQLDSSIANALLADFMTLLAALAKADTSENTGNALSCKALVDELSMDIERSPAWLLNQTQHDFSHHPDTLPVWLEQQAQLTPDAVALVYQPSKRVNGDQHPEQHAVLTYAQLHEKSAQLAHYLINEHGCKSEDKVAVCMTRSPQMVLSLLAILKAGCAYLPLDPEHPSQRLAYIAENANAKVVLTLEACRNTLSSELQTTAVIVDEALDICASYPTTTPQVRILPEQLAYVLYTSGSTGQPKGVAIPHAGIVNRLAWMQQQYTLTDQDVVLQKTPYSFDVSVWEFFWPLITGAKLVVAEPNAHKDSARLAAIIQQHQITTIHFVPAMLQAFLDHSAVSDCRSLKRVICSGEALPYQLQQQFSQSFDAQLHNLYGPTEASIDVTFWDCRSQDIPNVVPIGHPIANMQTWILDKALNTVPVGVEGELYLAGVGLARGYLGRDDLTEKAFIANPFAVEGANTDAQFSRLYRTGDIARYRPDGAIEYVGRADFQVKIRGLRIELGEIEACIAEHPEVKEVVVIARRSGETNDYLAAYVVPEETAKGQLDDLLMWQAFLLTKLPDYMMPTFVTVLAQMPVTNNGKIDRAALPEPKSSGQAFVAPATPTEHKVALLWQELLGVEAAGRTDNFFALGGHSLLITRLVNQINSIFSLNISLTDVLAMTVLEQQASYIDMLIAQSQSQSQIESEEQWESFEL